MAIVAVSRWKGNLEQALPIAKEVAPILKAHGAVSVRVGPCYSGPHAGQLFVAITYADWASFGRGQQALATDPQMQRLYAQASKTAELQDRMVIVAEDV
jgi:hypothetical protein